MTKAIIAALLLAGVGCAFAQQSSFENSNCECVPYYQCTPGGTANEDGEGVIDIRVGDPNESPLANRPSCEHYLQVCCLPPNVVPGNDQGGNGGGNGGIGGGNGGTGGGNGGIGGGNGGIGGGNGGGGGGQVPPIQGNHQSRGCGYRNPNGIGFRITGAQNNEANFAEYPWMVAVLLRSNQGKAYQCGGSLIHRRVVLTAAHCVQGKSSSDLSIRAGEWDTQTTNEGLPHQDRSVSIAVIHPEYKAGALFNDFALLVLDNAVDLADNVEIVCLPEANEQFVGSNCIATGWGKSNFGDQGKYQVILKAVELPVVDHNSCQNSLRNTRLGKYFKLDQSFMCAGGMSGIDTCTGDGGSPLVCPLQLDPTRYTQAGIVAWGIGCGGDGVPGVYGDVSKARPWIDQALAQYNIDSTSFSPGANNNYPPVQG